MDSRACLDSSGASAVIFRRGQYGVKEIAVMRVRVVVVVVVVVVGGSISGRRRS